jgi:putative NIF3 family GTP cyclohydrolase 1 type 2
MKKITIDGISRTLDDFLSYETYNPDSMVAIVNMLEPSAKERFSEEYLSNLTGLMQVNGNLADRVYCAVFPSRDVFNYLFSENVADAVLFVKHAMEWEELGSGFVPLTEEQLKLLGNRKISLYSAHAPVDNNRTFAPSMSFARQIGYPIVDELAEKGRNYGWVLEVAEGTTYDELHQLLIKITGLNAIQRYHHHDSVGRIAVTAGGGDYIPALEQALGKGCDTYITGILFFRGSDYAREHNPIFVKKLKESGLNGFGASHYFSEVEGIKTFAEVLGDVLPIPVTFIEEKKKQKQLKEKWGLEI